MRFFQGFRNTMSNIAQIVLVVILFPVVAILHGVISGVHAGASGTTSLLAALVGKVPLCEMWLDVLYQYSGGLSAEDVLSSTLLVILKAFPEALISAICVYICVQLSKKFNFGGLPIFATFVGLVFASIATALTGLSGNVATEIIANFGVLIIMFIGIKVMFKSIFKGIKIFSIKQLLLFIVDGLFAVITTAYISGLIMAATGLYATIGQAIGRVCVLTGVEIVAAVITGIIEELCKNDSTVVWS